jgi:hypothetical protein
MRSSGFMALCRGLYSEFHRTLEIEASRIEIDVVDYAEMRRILPVALFVVAVLFLIWGRVTNSKEETRRVIPSVAETVDPSRIVGDPSKTNSEDYRNFTEALAAAQRQRQAEQEKLSKSKTDDNKEEQRAQEYARKIEDLERTHRQTLDYITKASQIGLTVVLLSGALFVILSKKYAPTDKHWAFGTLGTLVGYWLKA